MLKCRAPKLRHEFLIGQATNASSEVTADSQHAAQCLLCTEHQHNKAQHIKQVLGNAGGGAISCIMVVTDEGLIEVNSQADIEHHTMAMCLQWFCLTKSTPPMIELLCSELGYLGIMEASRQILAGNYQPPPSVDHITKEFLSTLVALVPLDPSNYISCEIT